MMQSAYLCVILYVEHKKNKTFLGVLTWFLILQVKSKMVAKVATVIGDVPGPQ